MLRSIERAAVLAGVALAIGTLALVAAGRPQSVPGALSDVDRALTYFVATGAHGSGFHPGDRELAAWAFESWARTSAGAFHVVPAAEEDAVVRLYWAAANGSTFGETRRIFVNGHRGAAVFVMPDVEGLSPEVAERARQDAIWRDAIVYLTCVHEIGHALDLEHTTDFRDVMYSFAYGGDIIEYFARYRRQLKVRDDIRSLSGLSAADVQRLRTLHPVPQR